MAQTPNLGTRAAAPLLAYAYFRIDGVGSWQAPAPEPLRLIPPGERSRLIEVATARALEWFLKAYGHLRFEGYAKSELGYAVTAGTFKQKRRRALQYPDAIQPNVWTGETRKAFMATARPVLRAVGGRNQPRIAGSIVMNLPSYVNEQRSQVTNKTLRKISPTEGARIAEKFFAELNAVASRITVDSVATRTGRIIPRSAANALDIRGQSLMRERSASMAAPRGSNG